MKYESNINKLKYLFIIFLIGGIAGFIYEFFFYMFTERIIYNPGILYGPLIPIYGIGAIFLLPLKKFKNFPLILFCFSMLITGVVEFIGGIICFEILGLKLWSYEGLFLNINDMVCFRSVISFAVGSLMLHYYIIPTVDKIFIKNNEKKINIAVILLTLIFIVDLYISLKFKTPRIF